MMMMKIQISDDIRTDDAYDDNDDNNDENNMLPAGVIIGQPLSN